jgi:hypothetical protein
MLHPEALAQTLPILAKGMAGIFLVIGIIVLATAILNKMTRK